MFEFGKEPFCNRKPETAPHLGEFCFPLCWRCFGLSIGIILAAILLAFMQSGIFQNRKGLFVVAFLMIIPCVLDGGLQRVSNYQSNNYLRGITGFFGGIGLRLLVFCLWI